MFSTTSIIINGYFGNENLEGKIYKSKKIELKRLMPVFLLVTAMILIGAFSSKLINLF